MPTCQAKFRSKDLFENDEPCPKTVEEGQSYCRWHDPDDESWREIYECLEKATSEERTNIVLGLIEDHPEHILKLPTRGGVRANLQRIDLSRETLEKRIEQSGVEPPTW